MTTPSSGCVMDRRGRGGASGPPDVRHSRGRGARLQPPVPWRGLPGDPPPSCPHTHEGGSEGDRAPVRSSWALTRGGLGVSPPPGPSAGNPSLRPPSQGGSGGEMMGESCGPAVTLGSGWERQRSCADALVCARRGPGPARAVMFVSPVGLWPVQCGHCGVVTVLCLMVCSAV